MTLMHSNKFYYRESGLEKGFESVEGGELVVCSDTMVKHWYHDASPFRYSV